MADPDKPTQPLTLLAGVTFSRADLEAIAKEIEDNLRIVAELEEFSQATPWMSQQVQPSGKKA